MTGASRRAHLAAIRPDADPAEAAWWDTAWAGTPPAVGFLIPHGFEAYARLLHPAHDDERHEVTWADVAAEHGTRVHPEVQWHRLTGTGRGPRPTTPTSTPHSSAAREHWWTTCWQTTGSRCWPGPWTVRSGRAPTPSTGSGHARAHPVARRGLPRRVGRACPGRPALQLCALHEHASLMRFPCGVIECMIVHAAPPPPQEELAQGDADQPHQAVRVLGPWERSRDFPKG